MSGVPYRGSLVNQTPHVERMQDYVLSIPSLPPGSSLLGGQAVLQLDGEAPFALRGRAIYSEGGAAHQADSLACSTRFQNAYWQYLSTDDGRGSGGNLIPASIDMMFAGFNGVFAPIRPQVVYPASGTIAADLANPSTNDADAFWLIYRGVKIFALGSVMARQLPRARVRLRSWSYRVDVTIGATQTILRNVFQVAGDSDFILRAIQVGTQTAARYSSLMIQLRDSSDKPYSNIPLPLDYLAGNASAAVNDTFENVQVGNWIPGLVFPEIYLLRNEMMFFDLIRNDAGGSANVLTFNFIGAKVFPA